MPEVGHGSEQPESIGTRWLSPAEEATSPVLTPHAARGNRVVVSTK